MQPRFFAAAAATVAGLAILSACDDQEVVRRSDPVIVITEPKPVSQPSILAVSALPASTDVQASMDAELQIEPIEAIATRRDADPYRLADVDLSAPDESVSDDLTT